MARTQRRRTARALHKTQNEPATISTCTEATQFLSRIDWNRLTETLDGLLRIEFPSPFTDLEVLCPKEAWLAVDLTSVRAAEAASASLRHQLVPALDALAQLLNHTERLRPWDSLYESFWRRVLGSKMFDQTQMNEAVVRGFVRFVRAKGSHVALQWRGRGLPSSQVIGPLSSWLETALEAPLACSLPVRVALRFEDCQLTAKHVTEMHEKLLKIPVATADKPRLFEASTLRELSLSDNTLQGNVLHALAAMIQDSTTRRIDGLRLDSTMPERALQTPAYTTAFRRVVGAVVMPKTTVDDDDVGVSLSLEDCVIDRAAHVRALAKALMQATRPIRKLSLACWHLTDYDASLRFAQLVFTPLPTATDEFDLNVSCIRGHWHAVEVAHARVLQEAFATGHDISCRVQDDTSVYQDDEQLTVDLSTTRYYDVLTVQECGCCDIVVSGVTNGDAAIIGCVQSTDVADWRIDGVPFYTRTEGLIVDRCTRLSCGHVGNDAMPLSPGSLMASRVARLSMRHSRWLGYESHQLVSWGSALEQLNVDGFDGQDEASLIRDIVFAGGSLKAVSATESGLDASTLQSLLELPNLQMLGFAFNDVNSTRLETLFDAFNGSMLRHVDLRNDRLDTRDDGDGDRNRAIGNRLVTLLHHACTRVETVLLVLRHVETALKLPQSLLGDVAARVLPFLDTRPPCEVIW